MSGPALWARRCLNPATKAPATDLDFNQIAPAVEACVAGVGMGMFLSYQVAPYLADQRLQILLEAFESPPRPLSLVVPHARMLPTRTRVFIDWMREALQDFRLP